MQKNLIGLSVTVLCGATAVLISQRAWAGSKEVHPAAEHAAPAAHPAAVVAPHAEPGHAVPSVMHPEEAHMAGHPEMRGADMRDHREFERHEFHGRDVRHWNREEQGRWRAGRWNNTCYNGRCGWWWLAGGQWYFYDRPVYPYPVVVSQVLYVDPNAVVVAAPAVAAPVVAAPLAVAAAPKFYYYCDSPAGYYPAVQNCPTHFRQVAGPGKH